MNSKAWHIASDNYTALMLFYNYKIYLLCSQSVWNCCFLFKDKTAKPDVQW